MDNILYEYEEIKHKDLKEHIVKNKSLHQYFDFSWGVLKSKQYCGILNYDGEDYYLLPKIAKEKDEQNLNIFIYMLMYAYDIKLSNEQISSCENQNHTILEVFIQMCAQNLFEEFQRGLYKEYVSYEENLRTLRGKYLINENLKYNFVKDKIYCQYDEFSEDNKLNQFFLFTIKTLLIYAKDKKLLKQCELILDEVEKINFDINTLNINFTRLNQRFKGSFELAILLLQKLIPLFSKNKKSFAFLFDMNVLFEKFIAKIIKAIKPNVKIQNQNKFGDLVLKTDIILENLIIDTKYKILDDKEIVSQSDKFQVFAYGINYNIRDIMLLYPKHLEDINSSLDLGKDENRVNLKLKSIDLNYCGDSFDGYLIEIRNKMEKLI